MTEINSQVLTIKSTVSDLRLEIYDLKDEFFTARIVSNHLTSIREVYTYTDSHGFPNLLERLALQRGPWEGEEIWEGIEGDFTFGASCSPLGKVTFRIRMASCFLDEEWSIESLLITELGQLKEIAKDARRFFGPSAY